MGFLNLGHKDKHGKQRRIEHRGKYLRASRTGGIALRAQAQALGANLTANTQHGFRVSTTPLKYTQVALQNGRFVLRGRYGSGPFRFNLSKTGLSVSARNRLGSFNLLKPQRSSAKILGIQLRGKNAAGLQIAYMAIAAAISAIGLLIQLLATFIQLLGAASSIVYRLALATPYAFRILLRKIRNKRVAKQTSRLEKQIGVQVDGWNKEQLSAATLLILAVWGRGQDARKASPELDCLVAEHGQDSLMEGSHDTLPDVAETLENFRETRPSKPDLSLPIFALIARRLPNKLTDNELAEVVLQADEIALKEVIRTVLQERMLEVLADFAGLHFYEEQEEEEELTQPSTNPQTEEEIAEPEYDTAHDSGEGKIDLNSASFETLQALPHIGPGRAQAIIKLRPWSSVDELKKVDGIGPQRLEEIRQEAVAEK